MSSLDFPTGKLSFLEINKADLAVRRFLLQIKAKLDKLDDSFVSFYTLLQISKDVSKTFSRKSE